MNKEYKQQLANLAETLYEPFKKVEQPSLFDYQEIVIERPEIAQLSRTALFGWDSEGTYLDKE
jgi:hypothetical protein